jgi:hypothetical protein
VPVRLAYDSSPPAGQLPAGGYWVVLIGLAIAAVFAALTTRGARLFVIWYGARRTGPAVATLLKGEGGDTH